MPIRTRLTINLRHSVLGRQSNIVLDALSWLKIHGITDVTSIDLDALESAQENEVKLHNLCSLG